MADITRKGTEEAPDQATGEASGHEGDRPSSEDSDAADEARSSEDSPSFPGAKGEESTKTYNLAELKRLREMSHRASTPDAAPHIEDENSTATGRMTDMDQRIAAILSEKIDPYQPGMSASGEDDDDDAPTMMRPDQGAPSDPRLASSGSAPSGRRPAVAPLPAAGRPADRARLAFERGGSSKLAPAAEPFPVPDLPPEIFDEDSNDDGPTIQRVASTSREERGILARGRAEAKPVKAPFPELYDEDSIDGGPTKMRPPESLAPGSALFVPPQSQSDRASNGPLLDPARLRPSAPSGGSVAPSAPLHGASPSGGHLSQSAPLVAHPAQASPGASTHGVSLGADAPLRASSSPGAPPGASSGLYADRSISVTGGPPGMYADPRTSGAPLVSDDAESGSTGRQRLIAALIGVALGLSVLLIYGVFIQPPLHPNAQPAPGASASAPGVNEESKGTAAQSPSGAAIAPGAPPAADSAAAPLAGGVAASEARKDLARLREGLIACAPRSALPPTAAAVPSSLQLTRPDGYSSRPEDWRAPIFACAKWSPSGAMRYQLQWQSSRPFQEGEGIVWLDLNGDGTADEAFGFKATLSSGKLEVGEIGAVAASHAVQAP